MFPSSCHNFSSHFAQRISVDDELRTELNAKREVEQLSQCTGKDQKKRERFEKETHQKNATKGETAC